MERRRLFSEVTRRRLFSEESSEVTRRRLFNSPKVLVCQDCGHTITLKDVTTNQVCPNCGSVNRFNPEQAETPERRRLFSSLTVDEPNNGGIDGIEDGKTKFVCSDCGYKFEDESEIPSGVKCPKCGGSRVMLDPEGSDATDEILKEFSGKSIQQEDLQKLFTERGVTESIDSLINSGDASLNDEGLVCFSEHADLTRKLFSELVISVTKELHLVPTENKVEELIHGLEDRGTVSPKGIILVKKAHGLVPREQAVVTPFSETSDYLHDSGLLSDLKFEYSGKTLPLKEFMSILETQYNDAPDDLLDELVNSGAVKIMGSKVEII